MKLDKAQIVSAALHLVDEVGIDGLTTRLLAKRLGVQQPSLYWHFKSKRELLAAMNAVLLERHHRCREPSPGQSWQSFARENALSFRRALMSVRDGARIHAGSEAEPGDVAHLQRVAVFYKAQGFSTQDVTVLSMAIGRYVVGCVLEEQSDAPPAAAKRALDESVADYPEMAAMIALYRSVTPEALFLDGLELLIGGMEARMRAGPTSGPT
jgi:TetR/AcrR family tetracycline transcriptional repressor